MLHDEQGGGQDSLVDLNRAGTPLLEIVSQPELTSPEEAKAYLEEIAAAAARAGRLRLRDAGRQPALRRQRQHSYSPARRRRRRHADRRGQEPQQLPRRRAGHEVRSRAAIRGIPAGPARSSGEVSKATAGWDDARGVTVIQRRKEEASDYRYFPEPGPGAGHRRTRPGWSSVRAALGELPAAQRARLQQQYGLSAYDAGVLTQQGRAFVAYFEEAARQCGDAKEASNWATNQVLQTLNERKQSPSSDFPLSAAALGDLIQQVKESGPEQAAGPRSLRPRCSRAAPRPSRRSSDLGFTVVADEGQLAGDRPPGHRRQPQGGRRLQEGQDSRPPTPSRAPSCARRKAWRKRRWCSRCCCRSWRRDNPLLYLTSPKPKRGLKAILACALA